MEKKRSGLKVDVPEKEVDDFEHIDELTASPEPELLEYQRQKSTPKLVLTNIREDDTEEKLLEVDRIEELQDQENLEFGMMPAGSEQLIVASLIREGSIEIDNVEKEQNQQ